MRSCSSRCLNGVVGFEQWNILNFRAERGLAELRRTASTPYSTCRSFFVVFVWVEGYFSFSVIWMYVWSVNKSRRISMAWLLTAQKHIKNNEHNRSDAAKTLPQPFTLYAYSNFSHTHTHIQFCNPNLQFSNDDDDDDAAALLCSPYCVVLRPADTKHFGFECAHN